VSDGIVTSISTGVYQLYKRYVHAPSTRFKTRKITRPLLAGFILRAAGVVQNPSTYSLDVTTGRLTIVANPNAATLTWTGKFYVPVHFMDDSIDWSLAVNGAAEMRYVSGPSVVLQEVRE